MVKHNNRSLTRHEATLKPDLQYFDQVTNTIYLIEFSISYGQMSDDANGDRVNTM